MTTFNPDNKTELTFGEQLGAAMEITDEADAKQYKQAYIDWINKGLIGGKDKNGKIAEEIASSNLGYYAGYYSDETRERVERLFSTKHPVFGAIKENGKPSQDEALECGVQKKTLDEIRKDERKLKNQGGASRVCPLCKALKQKKQ